MSIFEFDGGSGSGNGWNYSNQEKEDYSPTLTGDVVELSEVQSVNFATKKPEVWDDGNPKLNICMTIMQATGEEVNWIFSPGGRGDRASNAMKAVRIALENAGFPGKSMTEIAGCNVTIATQPGTYNNANPRPWGVQINGQGANPYRGTKKFQATNPTHPMPKPQASQAPMQPQQLAQMAQRAAQQVRNNVPVQPQVQPAQQVPIKQVYQSNDYVPYEETGFYYTGE